MLHLVTNVGNEVMKKLLARSLAAMDRSWSCSWLESPPHQLGFRFYFLQVLWVNLGFSVAASLQKTPQALGLQTLPELTPHYLSALPLCSSGCTCIFPMIPCVQFSYSGLPLPVGCGFSLCALPPQATATLGSHLDTCSDLYCSRQQQLASHLTISVNSFGETIGNS